jgi:hypothetical protein
MSTVADGSRKKREGGACRTDPIPEARWCDIEEWLREAQRERQEPVTVETPDPAVREVLGAAVRRCAAAPVRGWLPWTQAKVRACYSRIAATAQGAAELGMPLGFPRGKGTLLPWMLTRQLLGYAPTIQDDSCRLIQGPELTLLAARAARLATHYRHLRSDGRTNLVRVALVAEVILVIEARVGIGADKLGWNEKDDRVTGLLAYVVSELLPWLPGWPGTPRGLFEALLAARIVVGRLKLRRRARPL